MTRGEACGPPLSIEQGGIWEGRCIFETIGGEPSKGYGMLLQDWLLVLEVRVGKTLLRYLKLA